MPVFKVMQEVGGDEHCPDWRDDGILLEAENADHAFTLAEEHPKTIGAAEIDVIEVAYEGPVIYTASRVRNNEVIPTPDGYIDLQPQSGDVGYTKTSGIYGARTYIYQNGWVLFAPHGDCTCQ